METVSGPFDSFWFLFRGQDLNRPAQHARAGAVPSLVHGPSGRQIIKSFAECLLLFFTQNIGSQEQRQPEGCERFPSLAETDPMAKLFTRSEPGPLPGHQRTTDDPRRHFLRRRLQRLAAQQVVDV